MRTLIEGWLAEIGSDLGARIRHHGDYHLEQVLYTGKDFYIIDFEGDPARSLNERRMKRSPLRERVWVDPVRRRQPPLRPDHGLRRLPQPSLIRRYAPPSPTRGEGDPWQPRRPEWPMKP